MTYKVKILDAISIIPANDWNALGATPYPFLRHEFLAALEAHDCLGEKYGWLPRHIVVFDAQDKLLAATPLYLKFNSYGEFVFDWAWADAYHRNGLEYYPKLVSAAPYTPATGPKLLIDEDAPEACRKLLINAALQLAEHHQCSSLHWLFTPDDETDLLTQDGLFMRRKGCQFHWHNQNYQHFDAFLATFSSAKRKKIKRERRRVAEQNIHFKQLNGHTATEADWSDFHLLYADTFNQRGGIPTLSLKFFRQIAEQMPEQVLLVQAMHAKQVVAAAFCLVGEHTLYGRHWGCREAFHSLHFETCYYQGLDFCIAHGLQHFEPGAQGEHKVSRGFIPTHTWSAHWLADRRFVHAIDKFLHDEAAGIEGYMDEINTHSPYKQVT